MAASLNAACNIGGIIDAIAEIALVSNQQSNEVGQAIVAMASLTTAIGVVNTALDAKALRDVWCCRLQVQHRLLLRAKHERSSF